jgi:hypothetical protein
MWNLHPRFKAALIWEEDLMPDKFIQSTTAFCAVENYVSSSHCRVERRNKQLLYLSILA